MAGETNFDPVLLRTFLAVANGLSFTRAAEQLGLSQPTVSQHVRRLEEAGKRQLVRRDTRSVALTDNGEAMAGFARTILAANDEAVSYFTGSAMSGRLRFGAADELALSELPTILREFRQLYPRINLELTVTQSGTLSRRLAANHLDLIFINQEADLGRGQLVRRDRLVWVGHRPAAAGAGAAGARDHLPRAEPQPLGRDRRARARPTGPGGSPATPARSTACWPRPGRASGSACWPRAGCRATCASSRAGSTCRRCPTSRWPWWPTRARPGEPVEALSRAIVNLPLGPHASPQDRARR